MMAISTNSNISAIKPSQGVMLCFFSAVFAELIFPLSDVNLFFSVGRILLVFLSLYAIHRFSLVTLLRYRPNLKDLFFTHSILVFSLVTFWLGDILSSAISLSSEQYLLGKVGVQSLYFAVPFAAGGLLIQAIKGLSFSLVFAIKLTVVFGIYSPGDAILTPYVLITVLVACLSLTRLRSRSAYLKAGVNIAIVAMPFSLVACCISSGEVVSYQALVHVIAALTCGLLSSFIAIGLTPIIEHVGGYVTDMKLIEMSTIDHPLLKEMSIQAPGTWNHSMVIGMMIEAAADVIGANPILCRVGSYFHDIGKMKKPLYFVENQGGGENRHDKLSPSMSALIIKSHVKDGVEMAKEYDLPVDVQDMIEQHHGTSLIEYFYQKACKDAEESGDESEIDKNHYSYPGPKPQTREAALLMLADHIEPASRTLSEPTHDRIQGLVQKMINKVFSSGQLDECDLTLKDLHQIAKSFTRVLNAIYHQRIAYAEPAEKVSEDVKNENGNGNSNNTGASEDKNQSGKSKDSDTEDLKRLGLDDTA